MVDQKKLQKKVGIEKDLVELPLVDRDLDLVEREVVKRRRSFLPSSSQRLHLYHDKSSTLKDLVDFWNRRLEKKVGKDRSSPNVLDWQLELDSSSTNRSERRDVLDRKDKQLEERTVGFRKHLLESELPS